MTDALPFPGPEKGDCPCACGLFGTFRKKACGDGLRHVRGCPCRRCMAPRYKQRATRREHTVAAATRGTRNLGSGAFGGNDVREGLCEVEETANEAVVRGLRRWWASKTVRVKVAKLMAVGGKPRAFVASWDSAPQLVVMPFGDWADLQRVIEQEAG